MLVVLCGFTLPAVWVSALWNGLAMSQKRCVGCAVANFVIISQLYLLDPKTDLGEAPLGSY